MNKEAMLAALKGRKAKHGLSIQIALDKPEDAHDGTTGKDGLAPDSTDMKLEEAKAMHDAAMKQNMAAEGGEDQARPFAGQDSEEEELKEQELMNMMPGEGGGGLRDKVRTAMLAAKKGFKKV